MPVALLCSAVIRKKKSLCSAKPIPAEEAVLWIPSVHSHTKVLGTEWPAREPSCDQEVTPRGYTEELEANEHIPPQAQC